MSALVGMMRRDGAPVDPGAARRALEAQEARGPDAKGLWCEGATAIGHAMFATTPEDDLAPQPFVADGGALVVVLDGRIDNRGEIAKAVGLAERGTADVVLVALAYARWGETFAGRLIGDFAIVIWDARRRELLCARDPLAARPLYVRSAGAVLCCASDPRALFVATGDAPSPNFEAMALFLAERYVERGGTLFRGVDAVLPGSVLCAGPRGIRTVAPAWPAAIVPVARGSAREREAQFRATLRDAVKDRMRAKGRIAAHVSGGLDSSSVATLATEVARERGEAPPILVRCVFPGLACDESAWSQAVADRLGAPIESVTMPGDLAAFALDAPYENPISMMLVRTIALAKAHGARVTLTGAGSDQLLSPTGYELAGALARFDVRVALALSGIAAAPLSLAPYVRLLREGLFRTVPDPLRTRLRALRRRGGGLPSWLTGAARAAIRGSETAPPRLSREAFPTAAVRLLVTRIAHNADYSYSLVAADRIAGAQGGDLRHPFFDRRVIDLLLALPDDVRAAAPPLKALLRRAMGASLPDVVRDRTTAAEFSPLVRRALVEPHGRDLAALLRAGRLADAGLIDPAGAAAAVERARTDDGAIREVMVLAWLEMWLRTLRR